MSIIRRNLFSIYGAYIANGILSIVVIPIAIRRLGTEGYGLFAIYGILASYVGLVDLGVTRNLIRVLATNTDPTRKITLLRTAFTFYLSAGAFLLAALPALLYVLPAYVFPVGADNEHALRWVVLFAVLEFIIAIPSTLMQSVTIADERIHRYALFTMVSGFFRYALLLGVMMFTSSVPIVVGVLVSRRAVDIFVARWSMGAIPAASFKPMLGFSSIAAMMKRSSTLSAAQFLQLTAVNAAALLVNRIWGLDALGIYRGAWDLASRVVFVANGIGQVAFPRFARMMSTESGRKQLQTWLPRLLNVSWLLYGTMACVGVLLAQYVLGIFQLRSESWTNIFALIFVGTCFGCHANLSYEFVQSTGRYGVLVFLNILSIMLIVVIVLLGSLQLGLLAAGLGWMVGQGALAFAGDALTMRILSQSVWEILNQVGIKAVALVGIAIMLIATLSGVGPVPILMSLGTCSVCGVMVLRSWTHWGIASREKTGV